jgi:uncharacterized protein YndB with AHSA1/START domain
MKSLPICIPDLSSRPFKLTVERKMSASPAAIYKAWTKQFDRWFASPGTILMRGKINAPFFFETHFRIKNKETQRHPHYGRFLKLERNRLVVTTWVTGPEGTGGAETVVTVRLTPSGKGTNLRLIHAGFSDTKSRNQHRNAWPMVLKHLDEVLRTSPSAQSGSAIAG